MAKFRESFLDNLDQVKRKGRKPIQVKIDRELVERVERQMEKDECPTMTALIMTLFRTYLETGK